MGLHGQSTKVRTMKLWIKNDGVISSPVYCQIHPPKTGGTFVSTYLSETLRLDSRPPFGCLEDNNHFTFKDYSERITDFQSKYDFVSKKIRFSGLVRHPYDRFVSQFRHLHTLTYKYDNLYDVLLTSKLLLRPQYDYFFLDGQQMGYWYHLNTGCDIPIGDGMSVPTNNRSTYRHTHKNVSERWGMKPLDDFTIPQWMKHMVQDLYTKDFEIFDFKP